MSPGQPSPNSPLLGSGGEQAIRGCVPDPSPGLRDLVADGMLLLKAER